MVSQWQVAIDDAQQPAEAPRAAPARIAAAIAIFAALTFADATPMIALDSIPTVARPAQQPMPSACGAEAVARAQREVPRLRPSPTDVS